MAEMMEFTFDGIVRQGFGFYNPNHAAALICAVFPFLWGWKKYTQAGWILTLLLSFPLAMTFSRTGALVLFFELTLYFALTKNKNWKLIVTIAGGILLILILGGIFRRFALDKAVSNRPEIWVAGIKLYAANPFGVGIGNSGKVVSNFMLGNIQCRTLINSHLTLLAECGLFIGFFWFAVIFYAFFHGIKKHRTLCAFAGLCLSGFCSSIFDWDLLTDFRNFGNLTLLNYILSWTLLIVFSLLAIILISGKSSIQQIGISMVLSLVCVFLPFSLWSSKTPKIENGIICTSSDAPLLLYDEQWNIKSLLPYCRKGFQIPLHSGLYRKGASEVILFGYAAEYAGEFPNSRIIYVCPPEFFSPVPNTIKIYEQN